MIPPWAGRIRLQTMLWSLGALLLALMAWSYYDYYVRTLYISEIVGKSNNPTETILVNLFDFDTGVTRYELNTVVRKSLQWQRQMEQVLAIPNPTRRAQEHEKLLAEMMQDPAMKKIMQKVMRFGIDGSSLVLKALSGFALLLQ